MVDDVDRSWLRHLDPNFKLEVLEKVSSFYGNLLPGSLFMRTVKCILWSTSCTWIDMQIKVAPDLRKF